MVKKFYNNNFQEFLIKNNMKIYSRNTSPGAVFAERFNGTNRNLLKKPVFEKGDGNWVDVLRTITKQYNNRVHTSTKLTLVRAGLEMNEEFVYKNLSDEREKINPKFQVIDLVRKTDLKKTLSKSDTTNWSYKL